MKSRHPFLVVLEAGKSQVRVHVVSGRLLTVCSHGGRELCVLTWQEAARHKVKLILYLSPGTNPLLEAEPL